MANKYYQRGTRAVEESYIDEFERMRDELDAAFEGVEADTDANAAGAANKNAFENISCFCIDGTGAGPVELIGDAAGAGTGLPIKEECWLDQMDVTAFVPAGAPGTAIAVENLTQASGGPVPLAAGLKHQHFPGLGLHFAPGDLLAVTLLGAGDPALSHINVVLTLHKEAPVP